MNAALALQARMFARSLTARITTVLLVAFPPLFSVGMVALARSASMDGPSAAKLSPYREGTFAEASIALAGQVTTVVSLIAVGFAIAWLVGREWADGTVGSLFSLPVTRAELGGAKVTVVSAWAVACISAGTLLTTIGIVAFGGGSLTAVGLGALVRVWVGGLLMAALALPFGWVAVRLRGYFGAAGAIIAVTAASQILASVGAGAWVPYVAPALWAGAGGADAAAAIGPVSLTFAIGFAAAGAWATVHAFSRARLD